MNLYENLDHLLVVSSDAESTNTGRDKINNSVITYKTEKQSEFRYEEKRKVNEANFKETWANVKLLLRQSVYMASTSVVIVLLLIVTSIQYWMTDYLKYEMLLSPMATTLIFVGTCVTAPISGIVVGGLIVQRYGGYEEKIASLWCCIFGSVCCACALILPFVNDIIPFAIVLWIDLFFGGAIVPNITGILISSLPVELRGKGNSFATILINGVGLIPAPYVYSAIYDATSDYNKKLAFSITINYSWLAMFLLLLSMFFRYRIFNEREAKEAAALVLPDPENDVDLNTNVRDCLTF
jgi:MFS family permease